VLRRARLDPDPDEGPVARSGPWERRHGEEGRGDSVGRLASARRTGGMQRWAARGLHILTGRAGEEGPLLQPPGDGLAASRREARRDKDDDEHGPERGAAATGCAAETPRDIPPLPSPRTQALLDSDLVSTLLSRTVQRGLERCAQTQKCITALFCAHQEVASPPHTPLHAAPGSLEELDALPHACTWMSHKELSPTSTVWSEWDTDSPKKTRSVSPGRKRRWEECDGGEQDWEPQLLPRAMSLAR
jgi:hypothetical protein